MKPSSIILLIGVLLVEISADDYFAHHCLQGTFCEKDDDCKSQSCDMLGFNVAVCSPLCAGLCTCLIRRDLALGFF